MQPGVSYSSLALRARLCRNRFKHRATEIQSSLFYSYSINILSVFVSPCFIFCVLTHLLLKNIVIISFKNFLGLYPFENFPYGKRAFPRIYPYLKTSPVVGEVPEGRWGSQLSIVNCQFLSTGTNSRPESPPSPEVLPPGVSSVVGCSSFEVFELRRL